MAELCVDKLTEDILYACASPPVAGVNAVVKIINYDDIDRAATTFATGFTSEVIDNLAIVEDAPVLTLQGYKRSNNPGFDLVKVENRPDKFTHLLEFIIFQLTKENKKALNQLTKGARIVVIVQNVYLGPDKGDAFEIYGFDTGLEIQTATRRLNDNDGVTNVTMQSQDGEEEPNAPYTWLDTDYATTKAAFDALGAEAPGGGGG